MAIPISLALETHLKKNPHQIAIIHNGFQITYAALDVLSSKYVSVLRKLNISSSTIVGIGCSRSIDTMALLLACARYGIPYVPLDPHYYSHPLKKIILDCTPSLIIIDNDESRKYFETPTSIYTLSNLKSMMESPLEQRTSVASSSLFCIIYTSGSTHHPKGIRRTANQVAVQLEGFISSYDHTLRNAQTASLNFTLALYQIFGVFCVGGTMVIIDDSVRKNPKDLLEHCNAHRISRINFVPHTLEKFLTHLAKTNETPLYLKMASCTGEPIPSSLVRKFKKCLPNVALKNSYGSTESGTIGIADYRTSDDAKFTASPGVSLIILDEDNIPLSTNQEGEIAVARVGDSSCNRLDPASENLTIVIHGTPYLKTGDLGKLDENGTLSLVGRNRKEAKINGYRIPFFEINDVIRSLGSEIEDSIVYLIKGKSNESYNLLFFYASSSVLNIPEIQKLAKKQLPEECLPDQYVRIKEILYLANEKINYRHLEEEYENFINLGENYE